MINENGVELLKVIGAGHTGIMETENSGRKFLVYIYDFSLIPATTRTQVYPLPDEPLKSESVPRLKMPGNPWPNPSTGMLNIPVNLPPGTEAGELILYNIRGQEVMRHPVNGDEKLITMPGGTLIPGTYVYKLRSQNTESQGKKITIR